MDALFLCLLFYCLFVLKDLSKSKKDVVKPLLKQAYFMHVAKSIFATLNPSQLLILTLLMVISSQYSTIAANLIYWSTSIIRRLKWQDFTVWTSWFQVCGVSWGQGVLSSLCILRSGWGQGLLLGSQTKSICEEAQSNGVSRVVWKGSTDASCLQESSQLSLWGLLQPCTLTHRHTCVPLFKLLIILFRWWAQKQLVIFLLH